MQLLKPGTRLRQMSIRGGAMAGVLTPSGALMWGGVALTWGGVYLTWGS